MRFQRLRGSNSSHPEARHFHVLASQGTKNSVPALHELVTTTDEPAKCKDCRSFAKSIIDHWQYATDGGRGKTDSLGTSMMRSLLEIGDGKLAKRFFEQVLPLEYATLDGDPLLALAELAEREVDRKVADFLIPQLEAERLPRRSAWFGDHVWLPRQSRRRRIFDSKTSL